MHVARPSDRNRPNAADSTSAASEESSSSKTNGHATANGTDDSPATEGESNEYSCVSELTNIDIGPLLRRLAGYHPSPDLELVRRAFLVADKAHFGQMRKSGEHYITHPVAVAMIVAGLRLDEASLAVALLHDTVEDTELTLDDVRDEFGNEIASLVDGVTKLSKVRFNTREEHQAENFRKMLIAMSRDIRVILIKLCDRVHNMRTMKSMPPHKRERIAAETLDIYAPLANRLGISKVKIELEDLSFRYLHEPEYQALAEKVDQKKGDRERYTSSVVGILQSTMDEHTIKTDVRGRPKHFYSIWKKMRAQGIPYEQVYDAVAFRLLVDDIRTCYEALGVVHSKWRPIPGRFKDYIALPKPNMYRSLHTTVIGPESTRIEIQIRTYEMHEIAEQGIAAHWKYKEGADVNLKDEQKFAWLKQLMEWQRELKDPNEFLDTVKVDLFSEEVYVFTPKGEIKVFPRGSTPVDFAYSVHTEVGNHCSGALVGGVMVPLDRELKNGDIVEIVTNKNQRPNSDWLDFVKTARARNRIRNFLQREQRERAIAIGREILDKDLRRRGLSVSRLRKRTDLEQVFRTLGGGMHKVEDLYARVGFNKLRPEHVVEALLPPEEREKEEAPPPAAEPPSVVRRALDKLTRRRSVVKVDGIDDVLVQYAKCCSPVPGDPVVGFITRGRGVSVHTRDCHHAQASDRERLIEVKWDVKAAKGTPIRVRVFTGNAQGLLASMSQCISNGGVNIRQANCKVLPDQRAQNDFELEVENLAQLKKVMRAIERLPGVFEVQRVRN